MHITSLAIKNFKLFKDVRLHFDPHLNVLTGANNSGKTTVLEALALWGECFAALLRRAERAHRASGLRVGDLRLGDSQPHYLAPAEVRSVRSHSATDLFHRLDYQGIIELRARVAVSGDPGGLEVGFSLRSARGSLLDLRFLGGDRFDYPLFNQSFRSASEPLGVLFASPVASLLFQEEFETIPKIGRRVRSRESMLVLRNRIYQLRKRPPAYSDFLQQCSLVLCGVPDQFELNIEGNETDTVELGVGVHVGHGDRQFRDLALLGSGALQIIEIMLALHSERRDLTLLLLDEPDSHIHRDIQRRLSETLRDAPNCQVFLTTHNESLIRNSRPEQIFHLTGEDTGDLHPITSEPLPGGVRMGLQPSPHRKVLQSLGDETALDLVNALESDRLVLVEGEDDAAHIQGVMDLQRLGREPFRGMYWAFGGVDEIFINIGVYRRIFQSVKNGGSLWDRAVLVFDRDLMTDEMCTKLAEQFTRKLSLPVFIWESYTMEATLLREVEKLGEMFTAVLLRLGSGSQGEPIKRERVEARLREVISAHATRWLQRLTDHSVPEWQVLRVQAYERLRSKRDHLARTFNSREVDALNIADNLLESTFERYARGHLEAGRIDHLTRKEEVHEVLQEVAATFGVEFPVTRWFGLFLQPLGSPASAWPAQWRALQQLVRP